MKGQINLEFLTATFVYLLAVGGVLISVAQIGPDLMDDAEERTLNLEVKQVSDRLLSLEGSHEGGGTDWQDADPENVEEVGLSDGEYHSIHPEKLEKLESFTQNGNTDNVNYSIFRDLAGIENQVALNFTIKPALVMEREIPVSEFQDGSDDDMLEGYWRFDGVFGDVEGSSGNDRDGEISGLVDRGVEGVHGTDAFEFNGGEVEASHDFEISDEITISTWIKPREFEEGWITGIVNDENDRYGMRLDSGNIELIHAEDGDMNVIYSEEIRRNRWVHLAVVRTSSEENRIFIDGRSVSRGELTNTPDIEGDFMIGNAPGERSYEGKIDEVRFYERSLLEPGLRNIYRGVDQYSKPGGIPITVPDEVEDSSELKYGTRSLSGEELHFLIETEDGVFRRMFWSDSLDFGDEDALREGDVFQVGGESYTISSIGSEGNLLVFSRQKKFFGPQPDSSAETVKLDRYGTLNGDVVRMEVFGW